MKSLERPRWLFEFYHQWDSFLPRVNWRDFTFICIEGEWNHSWPCVESRIVVLGLGFRVVRQLECDDDLPTPDDVLGIFNEGPELIRAAHPGDGSGNTADASEEPSG